MSKVFRFAQIGYGSAHKIRTGAVRCLVSFLAGGLTPKTQGEFIKLAFVYISGSSNISAHIRTG